MAVLDGTREVWRRDRTWKFVNSRHQVLKNQIDTSHGKILYIENITVSFDGFKALNDLTLYIDDGELRCLIGANGAGKSTLMDVITGKTRPDSGTAYLGQSINLLEMSEPEIATAGLGRKFQKPTVYPYHTVFENLEIALNTKRTVWHAFSGRLSTDELDRISQVLNTIGLKGSESTVAGLLAHGQKQWLEIGMLLIQQPRVLLVDEPVAGMTPQEVERTAELLLHLAGEHSVIVVEHDMAFVRSIAKTVSVLHQGSLLAEGSMDDIQNNQEVIEVYLGE